MADSGKRKLEGAGADNESKEHGETYKVRKCVDNEPGNDNGSASEFLLSGFETIAILRDSAREKNIFIHGKVGSKRYIVNLKTWQCI